MPTRPPHCSPLRYVLYVRKSSESEDRQVQSIEDQVTALRKLAGDRSLAVAEELTESRSAKAPGNRPQFDRMLALIRHEQADAILCWAGNRLSRNPEESGVLMGMLQREEIRVIQTVDREYRPEDALLLAIEMGMANQDIINLRRNVKRGMQSKIEKGWFPHRAPEGYLNDPIERTVVPDTERFTLLRRAWDLMLTGAYTVPQVKAELDRWGFRTRPSRPRPARSASVRKRLGGGPISRTALYDLFDNPFYRGDLRCAGVLYPGAHVPMVSREEFERVQRVLHKERHIQPQKREFAFTGIISCAACGCLVTAEDKVKRHMSTGHETTYRYYHCTGAKGCRKLSVSEEYVDERIRETLEEFRLDPDTATWILGVLERCFAKQKETLDAGERQRAEALAAIHRRRDHLLTMRLDGEIDRATFEDYKTRLESEETEIGREVAADLLEQSQGAARNAVRFCELAYDRFTSGGLKAKREVAQLLAEKYVLTLGTLEIEPHPLLPLIRAFEPVKDPFGSIKKDCSTVLNPAWYFTADNIRTLVSGGLHFDPLTPML